MTYDLRVAHCPSCGQVYQINLRGLCAACSTSEDAQLAAIERELRRNRQLHTEQVAERTSLRPERIRSWIRSGKIKLFEYPNLADACDLCAAPIRRGKLCTPCATRIQSAVRREYEQERLMKERQRSAHSYLTR
ncbi:hypothetical protein [Cohnella nanjingensis]|uniref:Flagellar protein n=1 Tax=Cohnella nanjingensis TaxID=1387779 RepID=A0A7X0VHN8_9BACL|nr:hypothetical protein [Cohnella nanjingensis]MBB6674347.1 hypothetical protein [Cohnella nanjingensis]